MSSNHWLLGVIVLIVVVAPVTGAVLSSTADGAGIAQMDPADGAVACNYSSLYNQTIDSVVSVRTDTGQGSGFVYQTSESSSASYIVTNAHVVGSAGSVLVGFTREESILGTVVGRDRETDLAVIRVNETPGYVEALTVADTPPDQGSKVAAIGNPFGLEETITHGIVSGLNRSMPTKSGFTIPNVVQTDTPINPGNSGGPLVRCDGTVVGVNSAGIAADRADNIGFAISPNLVNRVVPELIDTGEYDHSFMGISSAPLTPGLIEANDLTVTSGLYVHNAIEGAPQATSSRGRPIPSPGTGVGSLSAATLSLASTASPSTPVKTSLPTC